MSNVLSFSRPYHDLTGERFGRRLVLNFSHRTEERKYYWRTICDCGTVQTVKSESLKNTQSCGCLQREKAAERWTKHGMVKHPLYTTWNSMRDRCNNQNSDSYDLYGGRGIYVCERWNDFAAFVEDMGERPNGHTLDRINVNGPYAPENCRWATQKVQHENRRITGPGKARFTVQEIVEIKRCKGVLPSRRVAKAYNCGKTTILRIWEDA